MQAKDLNEINKFIERKKEQNVVNSWFGWNRCLSLLFLSFLSWFYQEFLIPWIKIFMNLLNQEWVFLDFWNLSMVLLKKKCITGVKFFFLEEKTLLTNKNCPCKCCRNFVQNNLFYIQKWVLDFSCSSRKNTLKCLEILPVEKEIWERVNP